MSGRWQVSSPWKFRDRNYEVSLSVRENKLTVQVQDEATADQWRNTFESRHIEELTRKTGNFKHFSVFVNMLESAIMNTTKSVALELLTYSDLETLKQRKSLNKGYSSDDSTHHHTQTKRYLILTYSAEFDRIHYPLALPYMGKPDPVVLQDTIRQLHKEIERYQKQELTVSEADHHHKSVAKLQRKYDSLLQEKEDIEQAYDALQQQLDCNGSGSRTLKKIIKALEDDLIKERAKHQRILTKKNEEIRALLMEVRELKSSERMLNNRVKSLTNELAILRRNSINYGTTTRKYRGSTSPAAHSRQRSSSTESRSNERRNTRPQKNRTPSPGANRARRFDPTAYVENRRQRQLEVNRRRGRSRSNSAEHLPPRPAPSKRLHAPGVPRSRSPSVGSRCSSRDSYQSSVESYSSDDTPIRQARTITNGAGNRKSHSRVGTSTPGDAKSSHRKKKHNASSSLDHSLEIQEIDARLNALQQYMKKSLDVGRTSSR